MELLLVPWPHSCIHSQRGHSEGPRGVITESAHPVRKPIAYRQESPPPTTVVIAYLGLELHPSPIVWPPHEYTPCPQDFCLPWGSLGRWRQRGLNRGPQDS